MLPYADPPRWEFTTEQWLKTYAEHDDTIHMPVWRTQARGDIIAHRIPPEGLWFIEAGITGHIHSTQRAGSWVNIGFNPAKAEWCAWSPGRGADTVKVFPLTYVVNGVRHRRGMDAGRKLATDHARSIL